VSREKILEDSSLLVQSGFQTKVFKCDADIAVIGGAMGSGKSYALILEVMKHIGDPYFRCGIFRKSRGNIVCTGGLWEELLDVAYISGYSVKTNKHQLTITFPSGATVQFGHANHPNFKEYLKGTQYTTIFIDEGNQFDEEIFKFLISRLRSKSKIKPYMRITTNPCEGWLKSLVKTYLNSEEYPILEECGQVKYLYFINNEAVVRNKREDFAKEFGLSPKELEYVRTFTFIAGRVDENKKLLEINPEYKANLNTLASHEKDRYLFGWWGELPKDGMFQERDFQSYHTLPDNIDRHMIIIDTALKASKHNDYTVATCWASKKNKLYLVDMLRGKWSYASMKARVESFIESNETVDAVYIESIQTGSILLDDLKDSDVLKSISSSIRFKPMHRQARESKLKRAQGALANLGHVKVFLPHNSKIKRPFLKELCAFSGDMTHANDDIADTFFDAINILGKKIRNGPKPSETRAVIEPYTFESYGSLRNVSA
jgi:predicted phage terminase large subunit-like protein